MRYQISEDAFNSLERVCDQLAFVGGLLGASRDSADLGTIRAGQLDAFISAHQETLTSIVRSANTCASPATPPPAAVPTEAMPAHAAITPDLLISMMDAASGEMTDETKLIALWDRLIDVGVWNPGFRGVSGEFTDMLKRRGYAYTGEFSSEGVTRHLTLRKPKSPAAAVTAKPRKRERLASAAA